MVKPMSRRVVIEPSATLEEAVYQCLGAASACWENLEGAGVFQEDRCAAIGEELLGFIDDKWHADQPETPDEVETDATPADG